MQVTATSRAVRQTPRKIGLVASLVRGRTVADAIVILEHTPKRAAEPIRKTIESAMANAVNNHNMDGKTLLIADLDIGQAPSMKRYRPAAHGRAQPYLKRSTNIRVIVEGKEKPKKKSSDTKKKTAKETTITTTKTDEETIVTKQTVETKKIEEKKVETKTIETKEAEIAKKPEKASETKPEEKKKKKRGFFRNLGRKHDTNITKQRTGRRGDK